MDSQEKNLCNCSLSDVHFNVIHVFVLLVSCSGIKRSKEGTGQINFICTYTCKTVSFLYFNLSHIRDAICRDNTKSAYAISSFPPTGYQPVVMITGSHVF